MHTERMLGLPEVRAFLSECRAELFTSRRAAQPWCELGPEQQSQDRARRLRDRLANPRYSVAAAVLPANVRPALWVLMLQPGLGLRFAGERSIRQQEGDELYRLCARRAAGERGSPNERQRRRRLLEALDPIEVPTFDAQLALSAHAGFDVSSGRRTVPSFPLELGGAVAINATAMTSGAPLPQASQAGYPIVGELVERIGDRATVRPTFAVAFTVV